MYTGNRAEFWILPQYYMYKAFGLGKKNLNLAIIFILAPGANLESIQCLYSVTEPHPWLIILSTKGKKYAMYLKITW